MQRKNSHVERSKAYANPRKRSAGIVSQRWRALNFLKLQSVGSLFRKYEFARRFVGEDIGTIAMWKRNGA